MNVVTTLPTLPKSERISELVPTDNALREHDYRMEAWEIPGVFYKELAWAFASGTDDYIRDNVLRWSDATVAYAIYREAVVENAHRDALAMNANWPWLTVKDVMKEQITEPAPEPTIEELQERLRVAEEEASTWKRIAHQRERFDDSHPAWYDFWAEAGEAATDAGYCEQYDRIVEDMGGVPRQRDYYVTGYTEITVKVPFSVSITARSDDEAQELFESDPASWIDLGDWEIKRAIDSGWEEGDIEVEEVEEAN